MEPNRINPIKKETLFNSLRDKASFENSGKLSSLSFFSFFNFFNFYLLTDMQPADASVTTTPRSLTAGSD